MTRRAAVLGHPIGHSLSPVLHRAAYRALGLDWRYDAIDVTDTQLPGFIDGLDLSQWAGLSLTMPLKRAVLPLLTRADVTVTGSGTANTVVFSADGGRVGSNTDIGGIVAAVEAHPGFRPPGSVGVIGSGATAASALLACQRWTSDVRLVARRPVVAVDLLSSLPGVSADVTGWEGLGAALWSDLVIVTLPGDAAAGLGDQLPRTPALLLDVSYDPWPTTLASAWADLGGAVVPGHQMLLWQAAGQVELMTGSSAPVTEMSAALNEALRHRT